MGYKTKCPMCPHENFYIANGFGYCFNCGYTDADKNVNAQILRRADNLPEIRDFYTRMSTFYHACITPAVRLYLHERGYTDAHIEASKIGYCPKEHNLLYRSSVARDAGLVRKEDEAFLGGRIVFPYLDKKGVCYDIRVRLFDDTEGEKYLSPYNPAYFRGADIPYNAKALEADIVVIGEAEIKADIAAQHGIAIVGLPGMGNWRRGIIQRDEQTFVICYDNQRDGRQALVKSIKRTAMHLDPTMVKVATLPLGDKSKQEIDTFIIENGAEAFTKIIKRAVPYRTWENIIRAY